MDQDNIYAVKIPVFNPTDPTLWFGMCESTFQLATPKPITESKTKFNYVVANLPPDVASAVRDVILNPQTADPYQNLKENIISRCGETSTQAIRKLLAGEQLGDRKPTELLRIMKCRAESHQVNDSLLLELFLSQLPVNVQSIIASIMPTTAQKAAEVADRIIEVTHNQIEVNSISNVATSSISTAPATHTSLLKEIQQLRKEVNSLRRSRSFSRSRGNFRHRSPSTSASKECWYHRKYKEKARKCAPPCSYQENTERQE